MVTRALQLSESLAALLLNLLPPVKTSGLLQPITQQPFFSRVLRVFRTCERTAAAAERTCPARETTATDADVLHRHKTNPSGFSHHKPSVDHLCCRALHWVTIQMLCVSMDEEIPEVSENVVKAITGGETTEPST